MSYAISPVVTEAFQAIEEFGRLNDPDAVLERLGGYLARFGFTSFLVTGLPTQRERLEPYILLNGWPVGWFSRTPRRTTTGMIPAYGTVSRPSNPSPGASCRRTCWKTRPRSASWTSRRSLGS